MRCAPAPILQERWPDCARHMHRRSSPTRENDPRFAIVADETLSAFLAELLHSPAVRWRPLLGGPFVAAVFMFTLASFLCDVAWNLESLVFFRIVQGGFSGPMIPGSHALLLLIFPPQRKSTALTIWAATTPLRPSADQFSAATCPTIGRGLGSSGLTCRLGCSVCLSAAKDCGVTRCA